MPMQRYPKLDTPDQNRPHLSLRPADNAKADGVI